MPLVSVEEGVAELRAMIGQDLPRGPGWVSLVTPEAIRHFAFGMGDDNPLWSDPDYAARGPYGEIVAPPAFVHTCDDTHIVFGLPGYQGLYMGASWRYLRPIRLGTSLRKRIRCAAVEEKETRFGGHMIIQTVELTFTDASGEVLAVGRKFSGRVTPPEGQVSGGIRYKPRQDSYTDEELAKIRAAQAAYRRRGAEPRDWEDTRVGDEIGPLVMGPLTALDAAAYYTGVANTGPLPNSVQIVRYRREHGSVTHGASRSSGIYRDSTGFHAYPGRAHLDARLALQMGMPGAFDLGAQRVALCSRFATDWAGDAGWVGQLEAQIRRPLVVGDTHWVRGRVTDRRIEEGKPIAAIEIVGENQHGELTTRGSAVVILPTREG